MVELWVETHLNYTRVLRLTPKVFCVDERKRDGVDERFEDSPIFHKYLHLVLRL